MSDMNTISLADKLQDLELFLKSQHGHEVGYGRALRDAILSMDLFIELEVLKSLGDLHLQKGKQRKNSAEFDKAVTLYATALLRCKDPDMGQTLGHRIDYMEKLSRQLLQGYTPQYQWLSPDYLGTNDSNVLRMVETCNKLTRGVGKLWQSVEESYTDTLVTAIGKGDTFLEVEVLKSLGDFYLEKGKKTSKLSQFSKAAAMYGKALTRCDNLETKQTLHHRVLYMVKLWGTVRARRQSSPNKSRPRGIGSATRHQFGNIKRPEGHRPEKHTESSYQEHLQEGCRALQTGDLDTAEQHFAAALKSVHVKYSKSDQHSKEAEPLYKLGDVYLKRGIRTKDGGDFTKAAALCNAALVRCRRQDIKEAIQEISKSFLKYVLNIEQKVDIGDAEKHRLKLEEHRDFVKEEITRIEQEVDPYSLDDDDPKIREVEKRRTDEIKSLFDMIVHQRNMFIAGLVDECMKMMGPPPCKYAMIGLGSQATGLVTPYSDLEFAILVENETEHIVRYFRNLTNFLHLKVINLGETILPAMGIKSLNNFYSKDPLDNWFYDSVTPRGFAFDGSMPQACKTPLGRGRNSTSTSELIRTPREMTKVLEEDLTFHLKKGYHLASILGNVCLITGEQELVDVYIALWTHLLQENHGGLIPGILALTHLSENAPIFENDEKTGRLMDVKKEMYRFSSLAVSCLALLHNIQPTKIWDTIENLKKIGAINRENAHHLTVMVSISAELRLRTYMSNGGQVESMSALSSMSTDTHIAIGETLKKVFYFSNAKQLMRYYYTERPTKHFISKLANGHSREESSILFDDSFSVKAEIYRSLCDYENYKTCSEQALQSARSRYGEGNPHDDIAASLNKLGDSWGNLGDYRKAASYYKQSLKMTQSIYGENTDKPDIARLLINLGAAYSKLGDYRKTVSYFEHSLQMMRVIYGENTENTDIANSLNNLGVACSDLGDYRKAVSYHEQSLQMRQSIYGENTEHSDIATSLENLGNACMGLGDYKKAISYHEQSLQMMKTIYGKSTEHPDIASALNNLGSVYGKLGDYKKAVGIHEQSLQMMKNIYRESAEHPDIASSLDSLGAAFGGLGDYRKAVRYHEQSLQMRLNIYGENTEHPGIAVSLGNLGNACMELGDHKKACSYYEHSLQMMLSICGENTEHPLIAASLNNMGNACMELGDHKKAFSYHVQSLQMRLSIYGENTKHPFIAASLNNLGAACMELGDHKRAFSYHEQSLQMRKSIYGENTDHPDIADSLNNLGNACMELGDHKRAFSYHEQSLQMRKSIYGENTDHPDIAASLYNLGNACMELGDHKKAFSYHEQSLQMRQNIYWENTDHPDIADSLNNLGKACGELGGYRKAVSYYEQSLQMKQSIYGEGNAHPGIVMSVNNLAVTWGYLGDHRKADNYRDLARRMTQILQ
ncbi:uncharacterized protein LOC144914855 [Branchiostoma floridae x Branchiostoma belcheri]